MNSRYLLISAVVMAASHSIDSIGEPLGESGSPIETASPRAGSEREPLRLGQPDVPLRAWSRLADAETIEDASRRGIAPQGLGEIPAGVWSYATYANKSLRLPSANELKLGATLAVPADPATGRPVPAHIPGIAVPQSIDEALAPAHGVYPTRNTEFGFGLSTSGRIDGYATWSGSTVPQADAGAARSSFYGSLLQGPPSGLEDRRSARGRSGMPSQFSSAGNSFSGVPALSLVGQLRKKGGFRFSFADSWSLNAGSRRSDYTETLSTRTHFMTVERNWENFRSSYSLQMQRVSGASSAANHVMQVAYALSPTDSVGLSFTSGREVANFGSMGILSSEVRRVGLTAQTTVARDWAFSFNAGYADHGDLPTHKSLRISIRRSF